MTVVPTDGAAPALRLFCPGHADLWRPWKRPARKLAARKRPPAKARTCSEDGCDAKISDQSRFGLCTRHAAKERWRRKKTRDQAAA